MTSVTTPDTGGELERVTSADGTTIAYERTGSGPPLVLVHGVIFARGIWELGGVRSTFAEQTTVNAMDLRNHGDSESSDDYSMESQFDDVVAVVESIDGPVDLLGHSAGANLALGAAPQIDNLRSLILHEPVIPSEEDVAAMGEAVEELMGLVNEGQNEQALAQFMGDIAHFAPDELDVLRSAPIWDENVETFPHTLLPMLEAGGEYEWDFSRFKDLSTPTLLLVGEESGHNAVAEELHDILPNSRLATFEGHGHAVHLVAPDRYTDEVLAFTQESN